MLKRYLIRFFYVYNLRGFVFYAYYKSHRDYNAYSSLC